VQCMRLRFSPCGRSTICGLGNWALNFQRAEAGATVSGDPAEHLGEALRRRCLTMECSSSDVHAAPFDPGRPSHAFACAATLHLAVDAADPSPSLGSFCGTASPSIVMGIAGGGRRHRRPAGFEVGLPCAGSQGGGDPFNDTEILGR